MREPKRLKDFDYHRPYFYMVTLRAKRTCGRLSEITEAGFKYTTLTSECVRIIKSLHVVFPEIDEVTTFTVMPDHMHLLIRIKAPDAAHDLTEIVTHLMKMMKDAGISLKPEFHDLIVYRRGELARYTQYIRENPRRARMRRAAVENGWFNCVKNVSFAGCKWYAYGNEEILNLPKIFVVKGSYLAREGSDEWDALLGKASRLGPGTAGVSIFGNELERACEREIIESGGSLIVLSPNGFVPLDNSTETLWHPSERYEALCAAGRVLFLSLWQSSARTADFPVRCKRLEQVLSACTCPKV